jgi:hypothetical protein
VFVQNGISIALLPMAKWKSQHEPHAMAGCAAATGAAAA